jgi:hypothetical protein
MLELSRTGNSTLPARFLRTANQSLAKHNRKPSQIIENNHQRPKSIASFCRVFGACSGGRPNLSRQPADTFLPLLFSIQLLGLVSADSQRRNSRCTGIRLIMWRPDQPGSRTSHRISSRTAVFETFQTRSKAPEVRVFSNPAPSSSSRRAWGFVAPRCICLANPHGTRRSFLLRWS